jgi:CHAT domain-containing protein
MHSRLPLFFDLRGRVYAQLNDFGRAMASYQKALSLARKTRYYEFVALTLNDIGALKLKQNQPGAAESIHEQALRELQQHGAEPKAVGETKALLADAQTAHGAYDSAQRNYQQALELQEKANDPVGQAQTHFSLGMFQARGQQWRQAQESFARAARLYEARSPVGESNAWFQMAVALEARHRDTEAKKEVEKAIGLAEKVRVFIPGADLKASYFTTVEQMYRFEIDLLLQDGGAVTESNQLEAFELFQRAQSRTLLDSLGTKIHDDLLSRSNPDARGSIQGHEQKLAALLHTLVKDNNRNENIQAIRVEETALQQIAADSISGNPDLGLFSNVVSANDIRQQIVDADSALIQFYLAERSSYAWVVTQSKVDFLKLPSRTILERDVRLALRFGMAGQWTVSQQAALARFRQHLAPLFAVGQKRWAVVPDGALHFFPFIVLTCAQGQDHCPQEVVKIPSASTIDMIRRNRNATPPAYALAIFADPVFDDLDSRVAALHTASPKTSARSGIMRPPNHPIDSLPRLRYTSKEAQAVLQLFPATQSRSFLEFAATREAADGDALQDFRIIHFATHSLPDEDHPELSKIMFSRVAQDGTARPGELFAKDVYQMKLSANLVVLSTCRGAIGKQQPGEGPMSLSRAFLFAGSKAVVASLWEVDDEATVELMQRFYRHMVRENLPPASALALAQSEFRRHPDKRLRNPYYWAGFELYGDWIQH